MAKPTHPLLRRAVHIAARLRERRRFRFEGLRFCVSPGVVNPTLFDASRVFARACLRHAPAAPGRVLELGSGSGLAAVVLAKAGHRVTAVDVDPEPVRNTSDNARVNGLSVRAILSCWDEALAPDERFDFIVSNPPFLPEEPPALHTALFGGRDLEHVRECLEAARRRLADRGRVLVLTSDRTGRGAFLDTVAAARLRVTGSEQDRRWFDTYFIDLMEAA